MLRLSLFLSLLMVAFWSLGQELLLEWKYPQLFTKTDGTSYYQITFEEADHLPEYDYLPILLLEENTEVANANLYNVATAPLSEIEKSFVDLNKVNDDFGVSVKVLKSGHSATSRIFIFPFRKSPVSGEVEKLISADVAFENVAVFSSALRLATTTSATSSKLASGYWAKIAVNKSGAYAIGYNMLKKLGFNPSSIDPRNVQVYGNGGGMLPQKNSEPRLNDLNEIAVVVTGESDGKFDKNDRILFYGEGPDEIVLNETTNRFEHIKNIYSDYNYYFITVGTSMGKRIVESPNLGTATLTITEFDDYQYHEKDEYNHLTSGREWYGEDLEENSTQSFYFNSEGARNTTFVLSTSDMTMSRISTNFRYTVNGNYVGQSAHGASDLSEYGVKGLQFDKDFFVAGNVLSGNTLEVQVRYAANGNREAIARLNYLGLNIKKNLRLYGGQTFIRSVASMSHAVSEFQIGNAGAVSRVWDVSDPLNVTSKKIENAKFDASSTDLKTFLLLQSYLTPTPIGRVANQDLHGASEAPDLLIVTPTEFASIANDLARFKRATQGLTVTVAETGEIYNEFSSGKQDISAIRDYVKHLYDKGNSNGGLKYLLLFGGASYDYKDRLGNNTNFVPIYESRESLNDIRTYSSDDYFAFMDDDEGEWLESTSGDHMMDLAVGRLPVKSQEEAAVVVEKIKSYSNNINALGKWRNNICFVADDGDFNTHVDAAEDLSAQITGSEPSVNIKKYFVDSYNRVNTTAGTTVPDMNASINRAIEEGVLIVNFNGHGSERQWCVENALTISDINKFKNYDKLPFFITATCEFGRYDDPNIESGAERLVLSEKGGAIGTLTTTRPVYARSNLVINSAFYDNVFIPNADGSRPAIGKIMMETKNASLKGVNNRNFSLLGDPSLILAYPSYELSITSIDGNAVQAGVSDTLKALGEVQMTGEVRYLDGTLASSFNGEVAVTVFDKMSLQSTLGQNGNAVYDYNVQENKLFQGSATVINGVFSFSFVVPKDIAYNYDVGKVSMYAHQEGSMQDAGGYYSEIVIGGTDPDAVPDNSPPSITLFMDDYDFVSGGNVNPQSTLLAVLRDENGINTAGNGIGHEITAILDGDESKPFILNDYYTADLDTYKSGLVEYEFFNLTPGRHTLKLTVWDTHNNSSSATIEFVVDDIELSIKNYPNPFVGATTLVFEQNRLGEEVEVLFEIYDPLGRLVDSFDDSIEDVQYKHEYYWEAKDADGNTLSAGVYLYRVTLKYIEDGRELTQVKKMLLFN